MNEKLRHEQATRNPSREGALMGDAELEWAAACEELEAALGACERRGCGISRDASALLDVIARDQSFGAASVRYAARTIRREMPAMVALSARVRALRCGDVRRAA